MNIGAYRLPFVKWFSIHPGTIKNDLIAGIIISLVAIPPALAYAQLSGMSVCYGLYAALIPTIVGALIWFIQAGFDLSRCPQALLLRSSVPPAQVCSVCHYHDGSYQAGERQRSQLPGCIEGGNAF